MSLLLDNEKYVPHVTNYFGVTLVIFIYVKVATYGQTYPSHVSEI